jgi:predicted enzyme related to lactoylglutathione lyase
MSKHPIVHVEISAQDLEAASKFYADIFGWKVLHIPEMNYVTFESGEGEVGGGLNPITDENPAGSVVVYIDTDDITATLDSVEESGGKSLVPKMPIPGMGWFGIFMDPTGNRIGLYTADPQAP